MKKSIWTIAILIFGLFVASVIVAGCGGKKGQSTEEHEHEHEGEDTTQHHHDEMEMDDSQMTYACPMHPEVTGKEGDSCSKCGMKLEPVKSSDSTDTHDH